MVALRDVLAQRAWLRRNEPFPHVIAWDVFRPDFYLALAGQLQAILDRQLSEVPDSSRFSRAIPGYDSYGVGFSATQTGPVSLFVSLEWRDMVSQLFAIARTPYIFAGAHHHTVGSEHGFVHNDFNPIWFPAAAVEGIQTPNHQLCDYKTGAGPRPELAKAQVARGAAVIYYLLNDGWQPGDGGETALYDATQLTVTEPRVRVAPENNSLVAFECSPRSFHTFLANRRLPRTSIIMWVHRPLEEAVAKYGAQNLEHWK